MLQLIRSHAGSWFIKFLLAGIIASFAMWGISDIIRGYGSHRPVATVGKISITLDEFAHAYKQALSQVQQMMKKTLTPEQIKEAGIAKQVLDSMVYKAALDQDIKAIGLDVSDATIRQEIHAIPAFLTKDGAFDKNAFAQILRAQGMSEAKFVSEIRSELQQHQLFEGLAQGLTFSEEYVNTLYKALEQPFQFVSVDVPMKKMTLPKAVTDEEVQTFYNGNKEQFRQPEVRSLTMLRFERDALYSKLTISEEELKEEYNRRVDEFSFAEKRGAQQIMFSSDDLARKALEMFGKGKNPKDIAKELKAKHKEISPLSRDEFSPEHADKVFAMEAGKPEIVQTDKGWMFFVVTKVEPAHTKSFGDARAEIETKLKDERFNEFLEQLQNKIEDSLAGGEKMQAIAKTHGLAIEVIPNVDKGGRTSDGQIKIEEGVRQDVLEFVFTNARDADSHLILSKGKDSKLVGVMVSVDHIQESHVPQLSQIKVKVTEAYKADLQNKMASTLAKEISQQVKTVDDLRRLSSQKDLAFTTLPTLSRASVDQNQNLKNDLPKEMIERMFALSKGENLVSPTKAGFKIIMLEKPLEYTPDSQKLTKFKEVMGQIVKKDFKEVYKNYLLAAYPLNVNQDQVDHVVGS